MAWMRSGVRSPSTPLFGTGCPQGWPFVLRQSRWRRAGSWGGMSVRPRRGPGRDEHAPSAASVQPWRECKRRRARPAVTSPRPPTHVRPAQREYGPPRATGRGEDTGVGGDASHHEATIARNPSVRARRRAADPGRAVHREVLTASPSAYASHAPVARARVRFRPRGESVPSVASTFTPPCSGRGGSLRRAR